MCARRSEFALLSVLFFVSLFFMCSCGGMGSSTSGSPAPGNPPSPGTPPPGSPPAPAAASKFLYVAGGAKGQEGFIASYTINSQTAAITPASPNFRFQPSGDNMVRSPQDLSFYGGGGNQVIGYIPSQADGSAQTVSSLAVSGVFFVAISPDGRLVFATTTDGISVFTASQGHLSPVAGSPFNPASAEKVDVIHLVVSPDGRFLFVMGTTGLFPDTVSHIFSFAIGSDGKLTPKGDIQAPGNDFINEILVDNSGRFVYATALPPGVNQTAKPIIHVYAISEGAGTLTEVSGSPFPFVAPNPSPASFGSYPLMIGPDNLLYVMATDRDQVLAFSLNSANGQPSQASGSAITLPLAISFDRNGRVAYILHADSNKTKTVIEAFTMGANGALTPIPGTQASADFGSDIAAHAILAD